MKAARILRERIASGRIVTGVLATDLLWPALVEYLRKAGYDYLIIDLEHGAHAEHTVTEVCALGRMVDFPVLIRPIDSDYATIRRTIDFGPCGCLLPCVEAATALDEVRDGIYLPPRGRRRPGGPGNYWIEDFQYETWKREVEDFFIVLPQIETRHGLANADAIAAHEITTAIAIGPYDLSADLGVCGTMDAPQMREAVDIIRRAGERVGKTMWRIGDGPSLAAEGFTFLCIAEPMAALKETLRQKNRATREKGSSTE